MEHAALLQDQARVTFILGGRGEENQRRHLNRQIQVQRHSRLQAVYMQRGLRLRLSKKKSAF